MSDTHLLLLWGALCLVVGSVATHLATKWRRAVRRRKILRLYKALRRAHTGRGPL